jgi:hypothetical protein
MMLLLCHNVINYLTSLISGIRKSPVTRLPLKFSFDKSLFINSFAAACFNNAHKISNTGSDGHSEKDMYMIHPSPNS